MRKLALAAAMLAGLGGPAAAQDGQGPFLFVTLPDGSAVGWGSLSLDQANLVAAGVRFVLYAQPQTQGNMTYRWVAERFYLDCKKMTIMLPAGQFLAEDRAKVGETAYVKDTPIGPGPVDDLLKLSICDGLDITGQQRAGNVYEAMDRAEAAMKAMQARQPG